MKKKPTNNECDTVQETERQPDASLKWQLVERNEQQAVVGGHRLATTFGGNFEMAASASIESGGYFTNRCETFVRRSSLATKVVVPRQR